MHGLPEPASSQAWSEYRNLLYHLVSIEYHAKGVYLEHDVIPVE
jgi:hypothetical protein